MKKFISMAMAGCMALSLAACGGSSASTAESTATSTEATSEAAASGSKTDVAFVTDVGNIDDSFDTAVTPSVTNVTVDYQG